jgi:hypothetical protein
MRTILAVLLLGTAMAGQDRALCMKPSDANCHLWSNCSWNGLKYRADGQCWDVWRSGPEVRDNHTNQLTHTCNDHTGKPRTCQKEFDKISPTQHVLDCLSRFRQHFEDECMPSVTNSVTGIMYSTSQVDACVAGKVDSTRDFVNRMCEPQAGGKP